MFSKKLLIAAAVTAFAGSQAFAQSFTLTDSGSSFTVQTAAANNNVWTAPSIAFDVAFQAQYYFRLGTSGAFSPFSALTFDTVNSGLTGTSVLNLLYNGSGFNVNIRYSLLGGATSSQVSEQIRITNGNNSASTFQLIQYNNYDTSSTAGTGDTVTRLNSSSMQQTGTGVNAVKLLSGATPIPDFSQLGASFSGVITGAAFTNLNTAAGSNIGETVSPGDAAFGYQWNNTISAGGTVQIGTDKIIAAVPEPCSIAALGLGALALLRRRRSRS